MAGGGPDRFVGMGIVWHGCGRHARISATTQQHQLRLAKDFA